MLMWTKARKKWGEKKDKDLRTYSMNRKQSKTIKW